MPTPKPYTARDGTLTWRVRFRLNGRATSETFPTQREADRFCRRIEDIGPTRATRERARTDTASDEYIPTLAEVYAEHMLGRTGITDGTRNDYDKLARRLMLPMFGATPVDQIEADDVAAFVNRLEQTVALDNKGRPLRDADGRPTGATLSAKTIHTHHSLLRSVLRTAVQRRYIEHNPANDTRLPRAGEEHRRDERFLLPAEYKAIEDAMSNDRDKALARLMVGCGLRWSEATALETRHVDFATGVIRVRQAWKKPSRGGKRTLGPPKSVKSRRDVQAPPQVLDLLELIVDTTDPTRLVFRNSAGHALHNGSWASRSWVPACTTAKVMTPRPRVHDLRHTHASWMLNAGASLEDVQEQLGHESIMTTRKIYGHLQPEQRRRIREKAAIALDAIDPRPADALPEIEG